MSKLDYLRSLVQEVNQKHKTHSQSPLERKVESDSSQPQQHGIPTQDRVFHAEQTLKGILEPSRMHRNAVVEPAHHVPFHESYPTFDKLNNRQLHWYLYWRQQVQKGIYPDVSEGYLFLYVFELLNFSYETKPKKVVDMLIEVYDAYRDRVARAAATLPSWIGDLYEELGEHENAQPWYEITSPSQYGTTAFEMYDISDTVPPFSLWKRLMPEPTSFYVEHADEMERCIDRILPALDQVIRETKHISLLQLVLPDKWVVEDARFYDWAILERPVPTRRKVTYAPKQVSDGSSLDLLKSCVRYIENEFRKDYGKKPLKLEEAQLSKAIRNVLDDGFQYFRMMHPRQQPRMKPKTEKTKPNLESRQGKDEERTAKRPDLAPQLRLDKEQIERLLEESHWVLGAIQALDEVESNEDDSNLRLQPALATPTLASPTKPTIEDIFQSRSSNGSLEELEEVLEPKELAFVKWFSEQTRTSCTLTEARDFIRSIGVMMHTLLDGINEKALDTLGDVLFEVDEDRVCWNTDLE